MTEAQLDLFEAPPLADEWREDWHNFNLRYCDVPEKHRIAWLTETSNWLHRGRRWPMGASQRQHDHCLYWHRRVMALMGAHGWWPHWEVINYLGTEMDTITWHLEAPGVEKGKYQLAQSSNSAVYSLITGAAIVRRKAKYYGLWKKVAALPALGESGPLHNTDSAQGVPTN